MQIFKYYVYVHIRPDNGTVFYVGKGSGDRFKTKSGRNKYWQRIVDKNEGKFKHQIVRRFEKEMDAFSFEVKIVALFKGKLCNMDNGGVGGMAMSEEQKAKLSKIFKGVKMPNRDMSYCDVFKQTRKGSGNPMFGKKIKESSKQKQRDKLSGELNYKSKMVLNTETGIYYPCLTEACFSINMKKGNFWYYLNNNKIPFEYV